MISFEKNKLYNLILILILILGILLRIKTYSSIRPLWTDETALACNILQRNIFEFFKPLEYFQKAPALFMMTTKAVTNLFGTSELALRLMPFLASIASLFLFYKLSTKVLLKKSSILVSNFLFAINYHLIYYSQEFKQYSTDVLLVLASLLIFEKLNLEKLTYKKVFLYSLMSILFILFSFPMLFVVFSFISLNLVKTNKNNISKIIVFTLPVAIGCLTYYYFTILPARDLDITYFNRYWESGFLKPNISSFLSVLTENLRYYFKPNKSIVVALLPLTVGLYSFIKENKNIHYLFFLIIFFAVSASLFHIYPIEGRIALYLFPIILLLMVKPLDFIKKEKKVLSLIIICLFLICFNRYNLMYFKSFFDKTVFKIQDAKTAMQIIKNNYKATETIIYNQASKTDYIYYRQYFNFNPTKSILLKPYKYDKRLYLNALNSLPKNQNYWFYFSFDYKERPVIGFVKEWLQAKRIKYSELHYKHSYILYAKL